MIVFHEDARGRALGAATIIRTDEVWVIMPQIVELSANSELVHIHNAVASLDQWDPIAEPH